MQFGKTEEHHSPALTEAFSIGLTCLDVATLTNSNHLYADPSKFNYFLLEEKLNILKKLPIR